jgi:hypothetical protein
MVTARPKELIGRRVRGTQTGGRPIGYGMGVDIVLVDGDENVLGTVFCTNGESAGEVGVVDSMLTETGGVMDRAAQGDIGTVVMVVMFKLFKRSVDI